MACSESAVPGPSNVSGARVIHNLMACFFLKSAAPFVSPRLLVYLAVISVASCQPVMNHEDRWHCEDAANVAYVGCWPKAAVVVIRPRGSYCRQQRSCITVEDEPISDVFSYGGLLRERRRNSFRAEACGAVLSSLRM
jgi:hypothetical protein